MPPRAVLDVDIKDEKFKAFAEQFNKFRQQLAAVPDAWQDINKVQEEHTKGFQSMAAAMMAQLELLRRQDKAERDNNRNLREQATLWQTIAGFTRGASGNIAAATTQLLKWTALTTVFTGILGAGGLFGIDRLAGNVASGRRGALGLGVSYGEQAAFGVNFGRLVDPGNFLGAVNEAQHDVTKRYALYGAGLREGDIAGKDTAQVGTQLLAQLKRIVDATPEAMLAQTLQARGLSQFISLQDAQRLRNTSPGELAQLIGGFRTDQNSLGLSPGNQKVWQDFSTQLTRAGSTIENVFVSGLTPLIAPLGQLSDSVTRAVKAFLSSPKLGEWITELGVGIEKLAGYIGSSEFEDKVQKFVVAVGEIADGAIKFGDWIGRWFGSGGGYTPDQINAMYGDGARPSEAHGVTGGSTNGGVKGHNPGNLRPPGSTSGFQSFSSDEEGYKAMQRQLLLYYNRDHLSSVAQIISKWAPPSENDTRAYIGDVAAKTGTGQMGSMNLNDPDQMSKLIAAIAHHENSKNNITPGQVKVMIYGAPGGNTIANAQQATSNQ